MQRFKDPLMLKTRKIIWKFEKFKRKILIQIWFLDSYALSDITTSHPSGQHLQSLNRLMSSCYTCNDIIMDYY